MANVNAHAIRKPADTIDRVVENFRRLLETSPYLAPDFESAGVKIGSATREDVEDARQRLSETDQTIARLNTSINVLKEEIADLKAGTHQEDAVSSQGLVEASAVPLGEMDKQRLRLSSLVAIPFDINEEDWPVEEVKSMLKIHDRLRDENISRGAESWLKVGITIPTDTDRSAREQAAWIFFQARLYQGGWSHADLQTLVERSKTASKESLRVVLSFLVALLDYKVDSLVKQTFEISADNALTYLRIFEFAVAHLSPVCSILMPEMIALFETFKPLVLLASQDRKIIQGLVESVESYNSYGNFSLAQCLSRMAQQETEINDASIPIRLLPDGTNLIVAEGDRVRYLRRCHYSLDLDVFFGFQLKIRSFPQTGEVTTAGCWPFTLASHAMVLKHFNGANDWLHDCRAKGVSSFAPIDPAANYLFRVDL